MEEHLEYDIVIYLRGDENEEQQYKKLGLDIPSESKEEKIVKYSFCPKDIIEIKQTYIKFQGEILDATIVTFTSLIYETPVLLVEYNTFKQQLKEWNENHKKTT